MKSTLRIKPEEESVEVNLLVLGYTEDGLCFNYSPELDLLGYGYTDEEAQASFDIVLEEFLTYAIQEGTIAQELLSHGWMRTPTENYIAPPGIRAASIPHISAGHYPQLKTIPMAIPAMFAAPRAMAVA
jgi:hypothetical protein